jgi:hypothetical protein
MNEAEEKFLNKKNIDEMHVVLDELEVTTCVNK